MALIHFQNDEFSSTGNVEIAELLIKGGANVNHADVDRFTPLLLATERGNFDEIIFVNRIALNMENVSVLTGQITMIKFLIKNGANVTAENDEGSTSLDIANSNGISPQF